MSVYHRRVKNNAPRAARILVMYYSDVDNTLAMAELVAAGAANVPNMIRRATYKRLF